MNASAHLVVVSCDMCCCVCRMFRHKFRLLLSILICTVIVSVYNIDGPHQMVCSTPMSR